MRNIYTFIRKEEEEEEEKKSEAGLENTEELLNESCCVKQLFTNNSV